MKALELEDGRSLAGFTGSLVSWYAVLKDLQDLAVCGEGIEMALDVLAHLGAEVGLGCAP
jgi:hypothetical protein